MNVSISSYEAMSQDSLQDPLSRHDDLLRRGVAAAQAEDPARARTLLRQAVAILDDQELSWLWLASVADTQTEIYRCMDRVLRINPLNEQARDWIVEAQRLGLRPNGQRPRLEELKPATSAAQPPQRKRPGLMETQPIPAQMTPEDAATTALAADATVFLGQAADLFGDLED